MSSPEDRGRSSFSRRAFLKSASGAAASAAVLGVPVLAPGEALEEPANRAGIRKFPSGGAEFSLTINGEKKSFNTSPSETLLHVLREQSNLTGCKEVCDRGACGACTVLVDGRSVNSCMTLAVDCVGSEITTVEGLAKDNQLDPVQKAFADCDACQCGYCIPGFVVRSRALLNETPNPNLDQIKQGLSGNICRCAAYIRIFQAVSVAGKGGAS